MYYHGYPVLDFLVPHVEAADVLGPLLVPPPPSADGVTVYAVLPERLSDLELIRRRFPGGEEEQLGWPTEPGVLVHIYRLRP